VTNKPDDREPHDISRRGMFRQVGAASAAAIASAQLVAATTPAPAQDRTADATRASGPPLREARETLTAAEADVLEAIVARLIPSDENGPGAAEAHVAYYIDRALGGALRSSREAYAVNLAATDAYAQSIKGALFAQLAAADQDAVLTDMEKNVATGFSPNAAAFFALVRAHAIQGMFCDPYYGGNANFIGWDLVGYPGIRMSVAANEQRLAAPAPVRKSAYDDSMFTMSDSRTRGGDHGHRP
jgi:gluconate 2-dehydrogenase gamma chain